MRDYEKYLVPGNIVVTGEDKVHGIILANGVVVYLEIEGYDNVSALMEAKEGYVLKVFSPTEDIKCEQDILNEEYLDLVYEYNSGISFEDLKCNTEYTFKTCSKSYVARVEMFDDSKVVLIRNLSTNLISALSPNEFKAIFSSIKFCEKE